MAQGLDTILNLQSMFIYIRNIHEPYIDISCQARVSLMIYKLRNNWKPILLALGGQLWRNRDTGPWYIITIHIDHKLGFVPSPCA